MFELSLIRGVQTPTAPPPGSATLKGRVFKEFSLGIVQFMRERSVMWRNDTNHYFECLSLLMKCRAWPLHAHGKIASTLQIHGYRRKPNMLESLPKKPYHLEPWWKTGDGDSFLTWFSQRSLLISGQVEILTYKIIINMSTLYTLFHW